MVDRLIHKHKSNINKVKDTGEIKYVGVEYSQTIHNTLKKTLQKENTELTRCTTNQVKNLITEKHQQSNDTNLMGMVFIKLNAQNVLLFTLDKQVGHLGSLNSGL